MSGMKKAQVKRPAKQSSKKSARAKAVKSEPSRDVPLPIRCMLWGRAAGHCEFAGCKHNLTLHDLTQTVVNLAEVAHIIGFSEDGPRGEADLSAELAHDITNLMLLCRDCHKTIDPKKGEYVEPSRQKLTVALLRKMKEAHETRIRRLAQIAPDLQSHVLLYGSNIGAHASPLRYSEARLAMVPERYPASDTPIDLAMSNSALRDDMDIFWKTELQHLEAIFQQKVAPGLATRDISHLSVFGIADQPLLIRLGTLLSDLPGVDVYQRLKEPSGWSWQTGEPDLDFKVVEPADVGPLPALVFSLSATVADDRIYDVLGKTASIWKVTVETPGNDIIRSKHHLVQFRRLVRGLMDRIKARHGEAAVLHVFPAMSVSCNVEFGRVRMPKADLSMVIYDENKNLGGFRRAFEIGHERKATAS